MESNNTNIPNFNELNWHSNRTAPITIEPITQNFTGIIDNNQGWNFMPNLFLNEGKQLLEVNLIPNGIEIIYKSVKGSFTDLGPFDSITKDIYLIVNEVLVFSKSIKGKYVNPKPATYTFDE